MKRVQANAHGITQFLSASRVVRTNVGHKIVRLTRKKALLILLVVFVVFAQVLDLGATSLTDLSALKRDHRILDFRVANLYRDSQGQVVGVKLWHIPSGAPVFVLHSDTVPQAFMWVDTQAESEDGLAHALEHLLVGKGTKGRYAHLLKEMRLSQSAAATAQGFNYYSFSSGAGMEGFFEQFHAWLEALYRPDFTDAEAEREFYHLGVKGDATTKKKSLIEEGTVYDEMLPRQGVWSYYYASYRLTLGDRNPFDFDPGGVPDEMRLVTTDEILRFYSQYYHLGPSTGFIFAISPTVDLTTFLGKVSSELHRFYKPLPESSFNVIAKKQYSHQGSASFEPRMYKFPDSSETDPGEVLLAWRPVENTSASDLKLLQLFLRGLSGGQRSILHKALIDSSSRVFESGATRVSSDVVVTDSPYFSIPHVYISGIPGNRMTAELLDHLRNTVLKQIREIYECTDQSDGLLAFNKVIASEVWSEHRSEIVWTKSPPLFGDASVSQTAWKNHLQRLEMDTEFNRSLSEEPAWHLIDAQLASQKNLWRALIEKFHLLDLPYVTASAPSPQLLEDMERAKRERIEEKTRDLMKRFQTGDEQEALSRFEKDELMKTREIDEIQARVTPPRFTDHPPLTQDDDIRYRQFRIDDVPVVASTFDQPPTLDIGLSFDLAKIPQRYYRLLRLLPRCLDSLGLKEAGRTVPYSDLAGEIQKQAYEFSITYPFDLHAKTSELTIRAATSDTTSFVEALNLIGKMMRFNWLDLSNADRLRDLVAERIASDEVFTRQAEAKWVYDPVLALRYQDNPLFVAVSSHFTGEHWDNRLMWLLHSPVAPEAIDDLGRFTDRSLANSTGLSRAEFSAMLNRINASGLEGELVEYWRRNLAAFPDSDLTRGMRQLTLEVQQDLRIGPAATIAELQTLQRLVLDRQALRIDLTLSRQALKELDPVLSQFVKSIPSRQESTSTAYTPVKASQEHVVQDAHFPLHVGFVTPGRTYGDVVFFSDFPDYSQLDHSSLVQVLSSNLLSGTGPRSFFMKTWESGLAYSSGITNDPDTGLLWYYADRSPDLPTLINTVNSAAKNAENLQDSSLIDYALRGTLSFSRAMQTPSERGRLLAQDIRDGTTPEKVRRFTEAILKLRTDQHLLSELKQAAFNSICGVLFTDDCLPQHRQERSIFFFIGSEQTLLDVEKHFSIHDFRRVYPSDYWME